MGRLLGVGDVGPKSLAARGFLVRGLAKGGVRCFQFDGHSNCLILSVRIEQTRSTFCLKDDNGTRHEFRAESFFNKYYLQTLFVHVAEVDSKRIVLPRNGRMSRTAWGA